MIQSSFRIRLYGHPFPSPASVATALFSNNNVYRLKLRGCEAMGCFRVSRLKIWWEHTPFCSTKTVLGFPTIVLHQKKAATAAMFDMFSAKQRHETPHNVVPAFFLLKYALYTRIAEKRRPRNVCSTRGFL